MARLQHARFSTAPARFLQAESEIIFAVIALIASKTLQNLHLFFNIEKVLASHVSVPVEKLLSL